MRKCYPYFWVFLLSFVVQTVFIFNFKGKPAEADAKNYYNISQSVIAEKSSILDGEINVRHPPIYPFFLAGVFYLFGNKIIVAQLSKVFLIAFSCMIIMHLGKTVFNEKIGLISGLLMAIHPVIVTSSFRLLTEALSIFQVVVFSYVLTCAYLKKKVYLYVLSGIILGLLTLTRPILVLFPFLLFIFIPLKYRSLPGIRYVCYLMVPFVLIVSAWTLRNYCQTKLFIPIASGGELEIWNGSYFPGDGYSDHPKTAEARNKLFDKFNAKNRLSPEYLNEGKNKAYYIYFLNMQDFRKEGFNNIREHPFKYLSLFPKKILYLYVGSYSFQFDIQDSFRDLKSKNAQKRTEYYWFKLLIKVTILFLTAATLFFTTLGLLGSMKNRNFDVTSWILLYWTAFFLLFSPLTRYSMPIIPLMIMTAARGVSILSGKTGITNSRIKYVV